MVSERIAYISLLLVIVVGMALILLGMWLSAGQNLNAPAIAGGIILLAGLAMMTVITVRGFEMQETPTHGED